MSIILKSISKSYGDKSVLSDFSYSFAHGMTYCVIGRSGSGKTTLLHLILGLIRPYSGDIAGVPETKSAVFQEDRLCEELTAYGNIAAVAPKGITRDDIEKCLARLGLSDSVDVAVSQLSGGMRRRVAIARALMADGELVILDEPFKGLDPETRENTAFTVREYTKGKTVIFSTHDAFDATLLDAEILCVE